MTPSGFAAMSRAPRASDPAPAAAGGRGETAAPGEALAPEMPLRRFKPYPEYKDSGVEWLGEIPAHWAVKPLKRLAQFRGGGTPTKERADYWGGEIPWVSPKDMKHSVVTDTEEKITLQGLNESATNLIPAGAVLLVVRSGILTHSIPVALAGREVTLNQDLKAILPGPEIRAEYLCYFVRGLQSELLAEWKKEGATVESLEIDLVQQTEMPLPAPKEQRRIAAFLDRETARIDALVAKKEALIALLQEKRAALITRAVTKGLDPKAPMKDSGIEWLGEIPAHWELARLDRLTDPAVPIVYGILLPGPRLVDGVPYIGAGDVKKGLRFDDLPRTTEEIAAQYPRSRVRGGEIVYAIRGSFGAVEIVPPDLAGVNLSRDSARIAPRKDVVGRWLCWNLRSEASQQQFDYNEMGAAVTGVNIRDLKRVLLPYPPTPEQGVIAGYLDRRSEEICALVSTIRGAIERLREFRTALISAAVTGKIDVREEVA